jgi:hypothetical protein
MCITDWFGLEGFTRVGRGTLWIVDDEHTAPAFTGSDGCVELTAGTGTVFGLSAPDYGYIVGPATIGTFGLVRYPSFSRHLLFIESAQTYGKQFDFRTAYFASLIVCDAAEPVVSGEPQEACFGHGIPGLRVALPGHAGRGVYHSEAFATDRSLSATTNAGGVLWQNVKPGKYEALVYPPDNGAVGLECGLWGGSDGRGDMFPGTNPVRIPLRAYPGAQAAVFVDCDVLR